MQDRWKNDLLKDVSEDMATMSAFNNSKGNFQEDDRNHQRKVEANARRAAFHMLFGKKPDEETDGSDVQQPALLQCELEELLKFGDKVVGKIQSYFRQCLKYPAAVREGIMEKDSAVILLTDLAVVGSLKHHVLRQVRTVMKN